MARRSSPSEDLLAQHQQAIELLSDFKSQLSRDDLRATVRALVPCVHALRDLGASLMPGGHELSARDRIITYLLKYPLTVIDGDELLVVSGIGEWARRVRELRVEFGWWINSGQTFKDIADDAERPEEPPISNSANSPQYEASFVQHAMFAAEPEPQPLYEARSEVAAYGFDPTNIRPDQYVLLSTTQDREAAHRWNVLNTIKKTRKSVSDKLLQYLRANVGRPVTGEELRYLAGNKSEWARRTRELRTQAGWPLKTRSSGRPDLPVGVYVLEADRQSFEHDRVIPDSVRSAVLRRDKHSCANPSCGWNRQMLNPDDPKTMLELHHIQHHFARGANTLENLITLCNVCHDDVHRGDLTIDPAWILKH